LGLQNQRNQRGEVIKALNNRLNSPGRCRTRWRRASFACNYPVASRHPFNLNWNDGHGRRVQTTKTSDGKLNYPMYSLDGKLLLEDNRQLSKRTEYIYAGGRLVAKRVQGLKADGTNNNLPSATPPMWRLA